MASIPNHGSNDHSNVKRSRDRHLPPLSDVDPGHVLAWRLQPLESTHYQCSKVTQTKGRKQAHLPPAKATFAQSLRNCKASSDSTPPLAGCWTALQTQPRSELFLNHPRLLLSRDYILSPLRHSIRAQNILLLPSTNSSKNIH